MHDEGNSDSDYDKDYQDQSVVQTNIVVEVSTMTLDTEMNQ